MVRASALFIVVFVSLVIGILCSALITIAYVYQSEIYHNTLHTKLELNTQSAFQLLLANETIPNGAIDLYGTNEDSVEVWKKSWGVFDVAVVKAFAGNYSTSKTLLYGYKPDTTGKAALYLADLGRPLGISGNTTINGDAYLPNAGVQKVYVDRQSFIGTHYVNGKIKKSKTALPELNKAIVDVLSALLKSPTNGNVRVLHAFTGDTLIRTFTDTTIVRYNAEALRIDQKLLSGNIIVASGKLVTIGNTCQLSDIVVVAPAVVIEDGFKGTVQVFAKDSIIIGKNCTLQYPSAVGLLKSDFKNMQPFIHILDHTVVQGIVFSHNMIDDLKKTLITISKDARVEGQVYAHGFLDVQQSIYGTAFCTKFLLKTKEGTYENTLLNATIDRSKLSSYYVGSSILPSTNVKSHIKWLR